MRTGALPTLKGLGTGTQARASCRTFEGKRAVSGAPDATAEDDARNQGTEEVSPLSDHVESGQDDHRSSCGGPCRSLQDRQLPHARASSGR